MIFNKNSKGGETGHTTTKTALLLVFTVVFALVLCGTASADTVTNETLNNTSTNASSDSGMSNGVQSGSDCLPTIAHGTIRGEVYISSTAGWPGSNPDNFNVPNGTVVFARYYAGVWMGSATTTFNGHNAPVTGSYSSGMGVTWVSYDVTDYVIAGGLNTATSSSYGGDGRQYGNTLVVVLQNDNDPTIEYWITEGLDWLNYNPPSVDWSNTTLAGTVNLSAVQNASLYSVHLTGYNYEDLNGNTLPSPTEYVGGSYFDALRWDNIQGLLVAENQMVNVGRGSDTYASPVFHALTIEYKTYDLVPVNLTPNVVVPNTSNTLTATIKNSGTTDSPGFNVSLLVDGTVVDTQSVTSLASGNSTTVDFHWTPDGTKDKYTLTINVDPDNSVNEADETNNTLNILVGSTSAPAPVAAFTATPTTDDAPLTVNFTDHSSDSTISWAWDFNNDGTTDSTQQNPTYTYETPGTYTVKLTVTNGSGSDDEVKSNYITVNTPVTPVTNFTATPTSGRSPLTVQFTDTSTNNPRSWAWDFDNNGTVDSTEQNPTHTYTDIGKYTVKLTTSNGAGSDSETKTDYIMAFAPPVAAFTATPTAGGSPLTVQFTDTSINFPTSWAWDFNNDGTTDSTQQNPTYTYTALGKYTVKLTATNSLGSDDETKTEYITVSTAPVAEFTATPTSGGVPLTVQFTDNSTNNPTSWAWDFNNDGTTDSTQQNPTYTYTTVGKYTVKLTTSNGVGSDSETKTEYITVSKAPVAAFTATPTSGMAPLTVQFTDKSINLPTSWAWDFNNDGTTDSTQQNPTYTYTDIGKYTVKLTVTNSLGSDDEIKTDYIIVPIAPIAAFTATPTSGMFPLSVQFTDTSINNPTSWAWDFNNDGTTDSTQQNPTYTYTTVGKYTVKLTASNAAGSDNETKTDYINVTNSITPVAEFTATPTLGNSPLTVQFTDQSTDGSSQRITNKTWGVGTDCEPDQYVSASWNFPQTVDLTGVKSLTFYYRSCGGGDIGSSGQLSIGNNVIWEVSNYGDFDSGWNLVTLNTSSYPGLQTLTFTFSMSGYGPGGAEFYLKDISAMATESISSWLWDFGDGTTSTEQNPIHTYATGGHYNVNLTVTSAVGNDSEEKTDYILVDPYDLTVTSINSQQSTVFSGEPNTVTINVKNNGTYTATNIIVNLYASDGTTVVTTTTIDSLASGATTTVTLVDPTIRPIKNNTTYGSSDVSYVNYTATTDPDNTIPETNENNNSLVSNALAVYYNGYKGKRYEYNGNDANSSETNTSGDINTQHVYDLKGDIVYSSGNSSYKSANWTNSTSNWTTNNLNIPTTGSVVDGWLYVSYNWDSTPDGDPNWTVTFNGVEISPTSWYYDQKNFGTSYTTYRYGLYVYNVTNLINKTSDNTLLITPLVGNSNALYPSTLVVVYSDPTKTRKQIFINEQCDELLSSANYGVTNEEATAYAPFTGLNINTSKVLNATLHSFAGSAGANEGNLLWNNTTLATNAWQGDSYMASPLIYDVTGYLGANNTAGIQGTQSGGMLALQQILVVEYDTIPPTVTANPGTGYYNTAQNVNLTATDNLDTNPKIYYTLNGATPTTTSTLYSGPITIGTTATLKYIAVDSAGNVSPVQSATYTMDTTLPIVTANPVTGLYNTTQNVTLTATDNLDTQPTIYYTIDGTTPNTTSTQYTGPITIDATATLRFIAVDDAGNVSDVQSETYTIDKEAPNAAVNPVTGLYNTTQNVTLTATDNLDTKVDIYYTLNGDTPTTTSTLYSRPITVDATATLRFIAVDDAGNISSVQSETYTIDTTKPTVTADLNSGSYNTNRTVTLSATDNLDTNPNIYFTIDETTPTTTSTLYTGPITIDITTTLKFMAVDDAGNSSDVQTEVFTIDKESPSVTASLDTGVFGKTQTVALSATDNLDTQPDIHYTLNGDTPTTTSTLYTGPITIDTSTTLKFMAADDAGNASSVSTRTYIIDTTAPVVTANPVGGLYNTSLNVTLQAEDNADTHPSIYYTTNGDIPTTSSSLYAGPIPIDFTTTLQFIAVDIFGSASQVQSETYTIDTTAPLVAVNLTGGIYNAAQNVALTASDNLDTNPEIHYTTNGDTPTSSSTLYSGPINISSSTTLKFIALDDAGNVSTVLSETYTIEPTPVAQFTGTPTTGNTPFEVQFTNQSTGTVTSYAWDFDNNGTTDSTDTNPIWTYNTTGTYTVKLTATGPGGSDDEVKTDYITVNEPVPTAQFVGTPTSGTSPLQVVFTNQSTNATNYQWDFNNDGTVDSTAANPTWTYQTAGTYTIKLTVTGPGGSDDEIKSDYITVNEPAPVAQFTGTPNTGTAPLTVTFTNTSTNVTSYQWDFDNNGTTDSTDTNPTHTYNTPGTYTVKLTTTGPGGTDDETKTNYITVNEPAPVADFAGVSTSGTSPLAVAFNDQSTNATEWAWDFNNDGTVDSTDQNPTWIYDHPGIYTVKLNVTGRGGIDEETKTDYITVNKSAQSDLLATEMNITSSSYVNYSLVEVTITNIGLKTAGYFDVTLYDNGTKIGQQYALWLASDAVRTLSFIWSPTTIGEHNLQAVMDKNDNIQESNENNNQITQIFDNRPDLASTKLDTTKYPLNYCYVTVDVTNNGEDLTEFYDVTLYDNGAQIGQQKVYGLKTGETKTVTFLCKLTSASTHNLQATTDATSTIPETNETNNTINKTIT